MPPWKGTSHVHLIYPCIYAEEWNSQNLTRLLRSSCLLKKERTKQRTLFVVYRPLSATEGRSFNTDILIHSKTLHSSTSHDCSLQTENAAWYNRACAIYYSESAWSENEVMWKYFTWRRRMVVLSIFAAEVLFFFFCFVFEPFRTQSCRFVLYPSKASKGWLVTSFSRLRHIPIAFMTTQSWSKWRRSWPCFREFRTSIFFY